MNQTQVTNLLHQLHLSRLIRICMQRSNISNSNKSTPTKWINWIKWISSIRWIHCCINNRWYIICNTGNQPIIKITDPIFKRDRDKIRTNKKITKTRINLNKINSHRSLCKMRPNCKRSWNIYGNWPTNSWVLLKISQLRTKSPKNTPSCKFWSKILSTKSRKSMSLFSSAKTSWTYIKKHWNRNTILFLMKWKTS